MKYICDSDLSDMDGKVFCTKGNVYDIIPASSSNPGEDVSGYYDISKCDDGNLGWINCVDLEAYFTRQNKTDI